MWSLAGSRFTTEHFLPIADMNWCIPLQYVLFPAPGLPSTSCANGILVLGLFDAGWWDSKGANRWWRGSFGLITKGMESELEKVGVAL